MSCKELKLHEFMEVIIPNGSTQSRFYLVDLANIRNVRLRQLVTYNSSVLPFDTSGNPVVTQAILNRIFLTLVNWDGLQVYHQVPLNFFQTQFVVDTAGTVNNNFIAQLGDIIVNYPKSYLEYFGTPLGADTTVPLSIFYDRINTKC